MKKQAVILLGGAMLALFSCSKKSSSGGSSSNPNTITIVINGTTYSISGTPPAPSGAFTPSVGVNVVRNADSSLLTISSTNAGSGHSFDLDISYAVSRLPSGVGTYKIPYNNEPYNGYVSEYWTGGYNRYIDSGTVNITSCSSANVAGTFQLWSSTNGVYETYTGTINANQPNVK